MSNYKIVKFLGKPQDLTNIRNALRKECIFFVTGSKTKYKKRFVCLNFKRSRLFLLLCFFQPGGLKCERDMDLSWVDVDTEKASTFITDIKLSTNLEFTPMLVSMSDLYETNKKLFIQFERKIQHPCVFLSDQKIPDAPHMSITEAFMTVATHFPRDKTGLHLGNI